LVLFEPHVLACLGSIVFFVDPHDVIVLLLCCDAIGVVVGVGVGGVVVVVVSARN
jgi:hypothetical protein